MCFHEDECNGLITEVEHRGAISNTIAFTCLLKDSTTIGSLYPTQKQSQLLLRFSETRRSLTIKVLSGRLYSGASRDRLPLISLSFFRVHTAECCSSTPACNSRTVLRELNRLEKYNLFRSCQFGFPFSLTLSLKYDAEWGAMNC